MPRVEAVHHIRSQLKDDSAKLKKLLAERMLDAAALRELSSKMVGPRRQAQACCASPQPAPT
jgi:hypothetical protein